MSAYIGNTYSNNSIVHLTNGTHTKEECAVDSPQSYTTFHSGDNYVHSKTITLTRIDNYISSDFKKGNSVNVQYRVNGVSEDEFIELCNDLFYMVLVPNTASVPCTFISGYDEQSVRKGQLLNRPYATYHQSRVFFRSKAEYLCGYGQPAEVSFELTFPPTLEVVFISNDIFSISKLPQDSLEVSNKGIILKDGTNILTDSYLQVTDTLGSSFNNEVDKIYSTCLGKTTVETTFPNGNKLFKNERVRAQFLTPMNEKSKSVNGYSVNLDSGKIYSNNVQVLGKGINLLVKHSTYKYKSTYPVGLEPVFGAYIGDSYGSVPPPDMTYDEFKSMRDNIKHTNSFFNLEDNDIVFIKLSVTLVRNGTSMTDTYFANVILVGDSVYEYYESISTNSGIQWTSFDYTEISMHVYDGSLYFNVNRFSSSLFQQAAISMVNNDGSISKRVDLKNWEITATKCRY